MGLTPYGLILLLFVLGWGGTNIVAKIIFLRIQLGYA
jgi:hypothetical protein